MPVISDEEKARRRQEILDSARECFAEYGYEGATVRRLEEATGKSRGAIFHHFADKESLFLEIAREDAARQAEIVSSAGLIEVMRDILRNPEEHEWISTRVEISSLLRTDSNFRHRWRDQQTVLDDAIASRLKKNLEAGSMREDVSVEVLQEFLELVMDGFMLRIASGQDLAKMGEVLDVAEDAVRKH